MPPPASSTEQEQDNGSAEILGAVQVISFKAEPPNIGPFGASLISWQTDGPPGYTLKLAGLSVPRAGDQVVTPLATTTFILSAHAGGAVRVLGSVTVSVDAASCETFTPVLNPKQTFETTLTVGVESDPTLSFRRTPAGGRPGGTPRTLLPVVTFAPGRISFSLRLRKSVDILPDPSIDIDASFGLTIVDGTLVAVDEKTSVSVEFPFYTWLIPGAIIGLAPAIDSGHEDARKQAHNAVLGLVQLLNVATVPSAGKRPRTVRVDDGNSGNGVIEVSACSTQLLRQFATISAAVVIK